MFNYSNLFYQRFYEQINTLNDTVSQLNSQQEVGDDLGLCGLNLQIVLEKTDIKRPGG